MLDSPDGLAPLAVIGLVLAFAAWTLVRMVGESRDAADKLQKAPAGKASASPNGAAKAKDAPSKSAAASDKSVKASVAREVATSGPRKDVAAAAAAAAAAAKGAESSPSAKAASKEPISIEALPSLSDHEDDHEVTQVTVSPLKKEEEESHGEEGDSGDLPVEKKSKVEVIFEEEAEVEEVTSPIARILVSASSQSDKGKVRKNNEDSLLVMPEHSFFVVADGMGGYKGGEIASALAVDTLRAAFDSSKFDGQTDSKVAVPQRGLELARAIQMANHAILERAKAEPSLTNMGTTVVAARFSPNKQRVYIGHVGDSRCYRIRGTTMRQLTSDHTMGKLGLKGPGADHLFQAVGIKPTMQIDIIIDKPKVDDLYILCSDGLSKMATDEQISAIARDGDVEAASAALVAMANKHGGRDNVTVILIKVAERAMSPSQSPPDPGKKAAAQA